MRVGFLIAGCMLNYGCATIISGTSQQVQFHSYPEGAQVIVDGVPVGTTPLSVSLRRKEGTTVLFRSDGYHDAVVPVSTRFNAVFLGNFICGGLLGSTTDFASGAVIQYSPDSYYATLHPQSSSAQSSSRIDRIMHERRTIHYVLTNYAELTSDMVVGEGEYITGLMAIVRRPELKQQDQATVVSRLRKLHARYEDPARFAEAVAVRM